MRLSRRDLVKLGAGAGVSLGLGWRPTAGQTKPLIQKPIPSSGEMIPVVGIGTARRYNVETEAELAPIREVLRRYPDLGGRLIDTAPGYGRAETVVGRLVNEIGNRDRMFLATKVAVGGRRGQPGGDTIQAGKDQMERSMRLLHTDKIDLMQVHNLRDVDTQLGTLQEWKQDGRIRYLGITSTSSRQYEAFERVMREYELDFVQMAYTIDNRGVEERLLPLAADRGMAVLVALPYGRGRVFRAVGGLDSPLPDWAAEIDCESWGQFFLKWIVSHPSVTCAIPGTAKVSYLIDNHGAARGRLPDAGMRQRMLEFFEGL